MLVSEPALVAEMVLAAAVNVRPPVLAPEKSVVPSVRSAATLLASSTTGVAKVPVTTQLPLLLALPATLTVWPTVIPASDPAFAAVTTLDDESKLSAPGVNAVAEPLVICAVGLAA